MLLWKAAVHLNGDCRQHDLWGIYRYGCAAGGGGGQPPQSCKMREFLELKVIGCCPRVIGCCSMHKDVVWGN